MTVRDFLPPIITNLWAKKDGAGWFYVFSSSHDPFRESDYIDSFCSIPEINAIINLKANAFSNGRFKVIDDKGKEYPDDPILKRLHKPNWFQGQKEFLKQTKIFHEVFGNEYLYMNFPVGFNPEKLTALYTLPSNLVDCEYDNKLPFFSWGADEVPDGIKYSIKAQDGVSKIPLDYEQIIHLNDNRIVIKKVNGKNILKGESKMKALTVSRNNIKMTYQSRGMILKYRGANGALVTKNKDGIGQTVPLNKTEKEELQAKYDGYGTLEGQHQLMISAADLSWVQFGTNKPKDLGLFEETTEDFNKFLDAYGTPAELFVRANGATFENQNQARKGLYTETIIPEAAEWCGAVSGRVFPDGRRKLILDYLHLPIFQEDMKQRGDALTSMVTALSKALVDQAITIEDYKNEMKKFGLGTSKN